jgi:hypothetical protein
MLVGTSVKQTQCVVKGSNVTRLVELLPIGRLLALGDLPKPTEIAQILNYFFPQ